MRLMLSCILVVVARFLVPHFCVVSSFDAGVPGGHDQAELRQDRQYFFNKRRHHVQGACSM